ncbi:helix-turn-helix domain-containing protein [Xenorhabdus entomophaga]|uniref:helix-turn-helix domain-containing protein n=1 Tax=Xenorhabdus entomophaga TaxID=3136257 RepID=UPI0030F3C954
MIDKQLTETERYQIFNLKKEGFSQYAIAESLNLNPSVISRKLKGNKQAQEFYSEKSQLNVLTHHHFSNKAVKITPEI